jgi:chromosome segregation ATPase
MTLREEAMGLVALLPNPGKYSEKLATLLAAVENANATIADARAAELGAAKKLEVAEALLQSLTDQTDVIQAANEAAAAKLEASENDLARRVGELEAAKQQHSNQQSAALQELTNREQELSLKQSALDADIGSRVKVLHEGQGKLRGHHLALRSVIAETQASLAAIS